jgi:hypothetical protein
MKSTMKKWLLAIPTLCFTFLSQAQPTWSEDAAQIMYDNCTECHNPEGVGSVSFMEYSTAYDYRALIQSYVEFNIMPPWTADTSYQHYFDERTLTEYERNTIIEWASSGAPEGDPELAPPPPVYTGEQKLAATPDLVLEMPNYMSKATESFDDYVCISIPTGLATDRRVKAIEIIPGNRSIVHHCLLYMDEDGSYATDTIGGDCGGPTTEPLMAGYTPGASPTIFPSSEDFSSGMVLPAGSDVVFALHYPHGSYGEWDQTRVHFYFYPEPIETEFREILAGPFLQNWDFSLPPDEYTDVEATYPDVPFNLTVLSAFPHMHLLGKSIKTYAVTEAMDTVKFVNILNWDFDWQDFYWFKYMQHLPSGSDLFAEGVYDNTVGNPHNPYDPPIEIGPGFNTTDEMFLVYFHVMEYWDGDEFVNVDSLNNLYLDQLGIEEEESGAEMGLRAYPNPFDNSIAIDYNLVNSTYVSIFIYDMAGKLVKKLQQGDQEAGAQSVVWDGSDENGSPVSNGVYHYSMRANGSVYSGRIIKK